MNIAIKLLLGVGGTGATAASGYGIYEFIRPKNIGEKLLWEGKDLLKIDGTEDDTTWTSLYEEHKKDSTQATDKFTLTGTNTEDKESLKTKCKEVLKKKLSETDSKDNLNKARYWCVKDSEKLPKTNTTQQ